MAHSITTQLIMDAARQRGWQAVFINAARNLYQLITPSGETYYLRILTSHKGAGVNGYLAKNKDVLYTLIDDAQLATLPATQVLSKLQDAEAFLEQHSPIVIKPTDQSHGNGVTVQITTKERLRVAFRRAQTYSDKVIAQQQVVGDDYRLLFIGGRLAAAAIRVPASVVGDGVHTVAELIALENQRPERGHGYEKRKTQIDAQAAATFLGAALQAIPPAGKIAQVVGTANIGRGGLAQDVTDSIDPLFVAQAEKLVRHFKLEICGLDYIVASDGTPYFIEANTAPSLGLHEFPVIGKARDTPNIFLDWLVK